jgi:opacity protein-like surface antigen
MWRLIFLSVTFCLAASPYASAQSGFYVGASGGAAFFLDQSANVDFLGIANGADVEFQYDTGYQFAGKLGYRVNTNIRVEGEVAYSKADTNRAFSFNGNNSETAQDLMVLSGSGGLFLDLWPISVLVPYVGGGLGYANVYANSDIGDDVEQNVFMTFAEAGVPYILSPSFSIVPSVRFSWYLTDEEQAAGVTRIGNNLYNTQLQLGLNYHF